MSAITGSSGARLKAGPVALARTTMTASDTLAYAFGTGQQLILYNTTASPVTITMVGSAPTDVFVTGTATTVHTSSGASVTVGASATEHVALDDLSAYLAGNGTVTVTNGTGLVAMLINS
jgi:hypothetical protein